jgi:hypothetical protein
MKLLSFATVLGTVATNVILAGTPIYLINAVPPQVALHNAPVTFQLVSELGPTKFGYALEPGYPPPHGTITLSNGLFTYTPAPEDKFEFRVHLIGFSLGPPLTTRESSVVITPSRDLPPEGDLVPQTTAIPDEAGIDYLLVTQTKSTEQVMFNGNLENTYDAQISGKKVILDDKLGPGGLKALFVNPIRRDLRNLTIYAETLIIRTAWKLPGTNVTVWARTLKLPLSLKTVFLGSEVATSLSGCSKLSFPQW